MPSLTGPRSPGGSRPCPASSPHLPTMSTRAARASARASRRSSRRSATESG